jgi:hypothetical protein
MDGNTTTTLCLNFAASPEKSINRNLVAFFVVVKLPKRYTAGAPFIFKRKSLFYLYSLFPIFKRGNKNEMKRYRDL